ncbi:MAG: acyloxyacyl hydrolase [Bacteroidales bacterium]|nr:acyloxyacyl hydrolase [Bacteroidales bacterium]MDD4215912.1 acyloxyacyl hydrolase [Bacteroidales bacterium]MDY0141171.1 acyloxyacyl hydrolase [Bacteroidales bacterium]
MKRFLIIFLTFSPVFLFSQKLYNAEFRLNSGFIAPHRIGMEGLAQKPAYGIDLCFFFDHGKNDFYDVKYNSPYTGYGIMWQNLGNPKVLGQSLTAYSFMEFNFFQSHNLMLVARINGGLTYLTKAYNKIDNPENIAIGTNVNFFFKLDLGLKYKMPHQPFTMRLSGGLVHFSNGSIKKPNLGLNHINFSLGMAYQLNQIEREASISKGNEKPEKRNEFTIMVSLVTADEYSVIPNGRGGGFLCSTGSLTYNYIYSKIGKVGVSADVFYNENLYYWYDERGDTLVKVNETPSEIIRAGISIGHELVYKNISLLSYIGVYYYNKVKPYDFMYSRFGIRYYVFNNFFINATIKAYGFKAHYIESGIGFSFKK